MKEWIAFTGQAMNTKTNALVRFGTTLEFAISHMGGLTDDAAKLILGGPMMRAAQEGLPDSFRKTYK